MSSPASIPSSPLSSCPTPSQGKGTVRGSSPHRSGPSASSLFQPSPSGDPILEQQETRQHPAETRADQQGGEEQEQHSHEASPQLSRGDGKEQTPSLGTDNGFQDESPKDEPSQQAPRPESSPVQSTSGHDKAAYENADEAAYETADEAANEGPTTPDDVDYEDGDKEEGGTPTPPEIANKMVPVRMAFQMAQNFDPDESRSKLSPDDLERQALVAANEMAMAAAEEYRMLRREKKELKREIEAMKAESKSWEAAFRHQNREKNYFLMRYKSMESIAWEALSHKRQRHELNNQITQQATASLQQVTASLKQEEQEIQRLSDAQGSKWDMQTVPNKRSLELGQRDLEHINHHHSRSIHTSLRLRSQWVA